MSDTSRPFSPEQLRQRRFLQGHFAHSGELERIDALRGTHAGERCFVIGNGPSLAQQDLTPLRQEVTFATNWFVNHPEMDTWRPTYYCIASHEVFGGWGVRNPQLNGQLAKLLQERTEGVKKFFSFRFRDTLRCMGLFPSSELYYLPFDRPKLQIDQRNNMNLDPARPLDDGYTVVITFALFLARLMGFSKIYLLGCDCDYGVTSASDEKRYFYDTSLHHTSTSRFETLTRVWSDGGPIFRCYSIVRSLFGEEGIEVFNATGGGRLEVFRRVNYEDLVL